MNAKGNIVACIFYLFAVRKLFQKGDLSYFRTKQHLFEKQNKKLQFQHVN